MIVTSGWWRAVRFMVLAAVLGGLPACALPREITKTPRGAIEQLLLAQALQRSLPDICIPVPTHEPLFMEVTGLQPGFALQAGVPTQSWDLAFIKDVVAARLGNLGYRVLKNEADATYILRVVVDSFGTNQATSFFGLPPIQSVIIPVSLPQLTVYQNLSQDGYVRYSLDVIERATGRLFYSTPTYHALTYHDQYTILFFISYRKTDLLDAP